MNCMEVFKWERHVTGIKAKNRQYIMVEEGGPERGSVVAR